MEAHYHLCFQVGRVARQLISHYNRVLAPLGLTTAQYFVLVAIKPDEAPTMGELSNRTYLDNSTLTPIVDRLERDGWLERMSDPTDRRTTRIQLTSSGLERLPDARQRGDAVENAMREQLGDPLVDLLTDGLRKVARIEL
ncbi:MarR family transcriptional regulator [Herpetosiphon sp.]|uniref:Transcriptional regulator, MarR family n=1 Tax=Herpetosiphon aurantiacus (strain ATCC 23779 / DSM 785 / 114-95) TaxID=316274 RepID=A9AYY7_HERA2|nr:MarR family transcriptional regulator [Herpetosiphon sp.]ABX07027.1 transcriptional regulator, MarR family [Herpetosiphon aurantiacus DSM 785]